MKVGLVYSERALRPIDARDLDALKSAYGEGEYVYVDVRKSRNLLHHRKFFALLQTALHNTERYTNVEDLLVETKIRAGHYREYITAKGEIVYVPKSISFDAVDQLEFDAFYPKAIAALNEIVPGVSDIEIELDAIHAKGSLTG